LTQGSKQEVAKHDQDRFPTAVTLLRRLAQNADIPEGQVEWIEIHALANGEAVYRVRRPREDEPEGGFLPAP